ncbi:MAG: hypothetical protein ACAI35_03800 [Candidatus Methylacidiphilales bacterium]
MLTLHFPLQIDFPPRLRVRLNQMAFGMMLIFALVSMTTAPLKAGSVVKIEKGPDGQFHLTRNGKQFFINGVGGTFKLEELKAAGGNSIRTWGIESLEKPVGPGSTQSLLKRAEELDIAITAGIWVQHVTRFDYNDKKKVEKQRETIREAVLKFKDSPAILVWGLGNEMEGPASDGSDVRIWKELNILAGMIKEIDPSHPVMTVIAGANPTKVKNAKQYCPNIDILGVNGYASAPGAGNAVVSAGWDRPFVLTEFGPVGHWEVPKTSWGAPVEPTSTQKAANYFASQKQVIDASKKICLGTYAFLWGYKQEATSTWYGMYLQTGEKLGPVDAMSFAWTGAWPEQRCPLLKKLDAEFNGKSLTPSQEATVTATVVDPNSTPLRYEWVLMKEATDLGIGGEHESTPETLKNAIAEQKDNVLKLRAPAQKGNYRLFVYVRNGQGAAATGNIPFQVK